MGDERESECEYKKREARTTSSKNGKTAFKIFVIVVGVVYSF